MLPFQSDEISRMYSKKRCYNEETMIHYTNNVIVTATEKTGSQAAWTIFKRINYNNCNQTFRKEKHPHLPTSLADYNP